MVKKKAAVKLGLKVMISIVLAIAISIIAFLVIGKGLLPLGESGKEGLKNATKNATEIWPW